MFFPGQLDHGGEEGHWAWGVEWVWVGGYSAASTTIILLNFSLFIAVIRNRYLHYSFNYVVFALALRNICRVVFTLYLVFIAKLSQSKYPNEVSLILTLIFIIIKGYSSNHPF